MDNIEHEELRPEGLREAGRIVEHGKAVLRALHYHKNALHFIHLTPLLGSPESASASDEI